VFASRGLRHRLKAGAESHSAPSPLLARTEPRRHYYWDLVGDAGPVDGRCDVKAKTIVVAERLEPNARVVAGIHELAHALVAEDEHAPELTYAQSELIAESVAWSCCQTRRAGLQRQQHPLPGQLGGERRPRRVEQTAALTSRLADHIEAALMPAAEPEPAAA
jgi:hypothetical protein